MKSRNLYLTALACAAIALPNVAAAQEEVISETQVQVTCDPTTHYTSNWRDNWFIQIGAGINQPMVERGVGVESKLNRVDKKKMTVAYNFGSLVLTLLRFPLQRHRRCPSLGQSYPRSAAYQRLDTRQTRERKPGNDVGYVQQPRWRKPQPSC